MKDVSIDTDLVKKLVAKQFPHWRELAIRPVSNGGHDNRTFHLGDEMCVRMPSAANYAPHVAIEWQWLPKLAPLLTLPIPQPIAHGKPDFGYEWKWTISNWIPGEIASLAHLPNLETFARDLASFLLSLQEADASQGPTPSQANFFRGGQLSTYDQDTRTYIDALGDYIDQTLALETWKAAVNSEWQRTGVWIHGDIAMGNLLVTEGKLSAVIDFGQLAAGDPSCDMAIAWTTFSGASREAFKATLATDQATWGRGRGWALWKALLTLHFASDKNSEEALESLRVIHETTKDYRKR